MPMKIPVVAFALLAGALLAAGCRSGSSPPPLITTTSRQATSGDVDASALFASNCAGCHGANRQGGVGPALTADVLQAKTETQVRDTISNGRPGTVMPAWKDKLSGSQVDALARYLKGTKQ